MGDFIVGGILAAVLGLIIYRMIVTKRKGRSISCGSCKYAADCCLKDAKKSECHTEVLSDEPK